jgi:hypothetical protein
MRTNATTKSAISAGGRSSMRNGSQPVWLVASSVCAKPAKTVAAARTDPEIAMAGRRFIADISTVFAL